MSFGFNRMALVLLLTTWGLLFTGQAAGQDSWAVSIHQARFVDGEFSHIFDRNYFGDSHLLILAVSREFARTWEHLGWELEGQAGKHHGLQDHWEFNGLLVLRWHHFPWDRYLRTSLAIGEGISYATRTPYLEDNDHTRTSKLLNHLVGELTIGLPQLPAWDLSGRIHHRSGVFGLFNGVHGASNFLSIGLRHTF